MPRSNFQFKIIGMEKFRLKEDFEEGWTTPQGGYLRSFLTEKSALPLKQILHTVSSLVVPKMEESISGTDTVKNCE